MSDEQVKIVVYVPATHADAVRAALADSDAGHIGAYDSCSFSVRGTGRFRPLKGSTPTIGTHGTCAEVEEERIETICTKEQLPAVRAAVINAHPYEEPAIDVYPLLSF